MTPTLVLLAAGMSTRYGRLKQLEPVGPGGEALLDFSVFDARKAGFGRVVLIVREELEDRFREHVRDRWPGEMEVVYHHQRQGDLAGVDPSRVPTAMARELVEKREKPWGTAHALLTAEEYLPEPFVILNADDFYGESAFLQAASLLDHGMPPAPGGLPVFGLLGYTLADTLSRHGGVSRGICRVDREGWLEGVEEILEIEKVNGGVRGTTVPGEGVILSGQEPTSTNFWIFTPTFFSHLREGFAAFLESLAVSSNGHPSAGASDGEAPEGGKRQRKTRPPEFLIPTEVNRLLAQGKARVVVLPADGPFFGITHPPDREWVVNGLKKLLGNGHYPDALW